MKIQTRPRKASSEKVEKRASFAKTNDVQRRLLALRKEPTYLNEFTPKLGLSSRMKGQSSQAEGSSEQVLSMRSVDLNLAWPFRGCVKTLMKKLPEKIL